MSRPCHNCPNRTAECHATCEDYKSFRKECDKRIDERTKQNNADPGIPKQKLKKIWRNMKRNG